MPAITSANVAQAIVKLVAVDALPVLLGNLQMGNLVNRQYEPVLAQAGDTVNVPIPPNMQANNVAEGGNVSPQAPNLGNAQIVLNTHAEATFQIPDVTKVLAVPDLIKVYMGPAVKAIAEKIETDLLALYPGFTFNTPVGTANTALTEAVIDSAETAMFLAKCPQNEQKYMAVDANSYSALRQIERLSEFRMTGQAGADAITSGLLVKDVKGFQVFRSQYVTKTGNNTHNLGFQRDAIGLVIRRLPQPLPGTGAIAEYVEMGNFGMRVVMSYQPNTLAQQFTVDCLYGAGILRNEQGIQVNS
ncbi:MAG: hypothetical protein KGL39_37550 [Patescibacteria group bacterium]|nr:hypothetical protein [Patescibacteria group bacterium]